MEQFNATNFPDARPTSALKVLKSPEGQEVKVKCTKVLEHPSRWWPCLIAPLSAP